MILCNTVIADRQVAARITNSVSLSPRAVWLGKIIKVIKATNIKKILSDLSIIPTPFAKFALPPSLIPPCALM